MGEVIQPAEIRSQLLDILDKFSRIGRSLAEAVKDDLARGKITMEQYNRMVDKYPEYFEKVE